MSDGEPTRFDASDEAPHAPGPEVGWTESHDFDLVDPAEGLAGFLRLSVRPNEGAMEVGLHWLLPDGGLIAARHVKPVAGNPAELEVAGASFALVEPLARWRVAYDGPAHSLAEARDAADAEAWRKSRVERLGVELEFAATGPALGAAGGFRQPGLWSGTVWVSGDEYRVACRGHRAHAWGGAEREAGLGAIALWASFGDDFALAVERAAGAEARGWVLHGGAAAEVRALEIAREGRPGEPLAVAVSDARARTFEIAGEELRAVALPRARGAGRVLVREAALRLTCGAETGVGFLRRIDAGAVAGSA